jgi:cytoskeletal protein RodZ
MDIKEKEKNLEKKTSKAKGCNLNDIHRVIVILVLAGAIVILLYFYMQDNRNLSFTNARSVAVETGEKARSTVSGASDKVKDEGKGTEGVGEKNVRNGRKSTYNSYWCE